MPFRIAVVPGDGIGVDVTREAVKVLRAADALFRDGLPARRVRFPEPIGHLPDAGEGAASRDDGHVPDLRRDLHGRVRRPTSSRHAPRGEILLGTRFQLDLFANVRPVRCLSDRLCPLKGRSRKDVDFVVFRENTEGLYVGMGGNFKKGTEDEIAIQEDVNTRKGVERIIREAFRFAERTGRRRVTMSDKSNVLRFGHDLWQRVFQDVSREHPAIEANHLYVDALTMQMVKDPSQFEVIVTCNMFGDIVTDLGAQLQGGWGSPRRGTSIRAGPRCSSPCTDRRRSTREGHRQPDRGDPDGADDARASRSGDAAGAIRDSGRRGDRGGRCTKDIGGELGCRATGTRSPRAFALWSSDP
jgi:3-isopropylmalate dehydrogenase